MSDIKIVCIDNGPFQISGKCTIQDGEGGIYDLSEQESIFLCRCGASKNRPFCDGAHNQIGFKSEERARKLP